MEVSKEVKKTSDKQNDEAKYDRRISNLISLLIGIAIASLFAYTGIDYILKNINIVVIIIIVFSLFILLALYLINQYKEKLFETFFGFGETDLKEIDIKIDETIDHLSKNKIGEASSTSIYVGKKVIAWYSWKMYRQYVLQITQVIFVILGGIIGSYLLFIQNEKIELQNKKIEKQVFLEEASRRNNLVLLMNNILSQINLEITDKNKSISVPLIGRIQALAQGFQPYYFLEDSTNLTTKKYTPERAQLLLALGNSGIDTTIMNKIYNKTPFSFSYLKGAIADSLYLRGIDLREADLRGANLMGADLVGADLREADLRGANLVGADLREADLIGADLRGANIIGADLRKADLERADLRNLIISVSDVQNATFRQTERATLLFIDNHNNKKKYKLLESKREVNERISVPLKRDSTGFEANFLETYFHNAKVSRFDWGKKGTYGLSWHDEMKENYLVVESKEKTKDNKPIYILELKEKME